MEKRQRDTRYIRSLARGLEVLKIVSENGPVSLQEISGKSDMPYPTIARIVATLEMDDFIEREQNSKRFRVTGLVQSLSHGFQNESRLVEVARPHLSALTDAIDWPVLIATPLTHRMVVRESTHSMTSLALHNYFPGFSFPIMDSAAGRAWLAFCTREKRNRCITALEAMNDGTQDHAIDLANDPNYLSKIRQDGFAIRERNLFTVPPGRNSSIAAPIFLGDEPCAALALVYFASTFNSEQAAELFAAPVMDCASRISEELDRDPSD